MWIDIILERIGNQHDPEYAVRQAAALFKKVQRDQRSVGAICSRYMAGPPDEVIQAFIEPKQLAADRLLRSIETARRDQIDPVSTVEAILNSSPAEVPSGTGYVDDEYRERKPRRRRG